MADLFKRSQKALNVFTKVKDELKNINLALLSEQTIKHDKAQQLLAEGNQNLDQVKKNESIIKNIEKIIE